MILNSFWAWWVVLLVWSVVLAVVFAKFDLEVPTVSLLFFITALLLVAAVGLTVEYLEWAQAWPFVPQ